MFSFVLACMDISKITLSVKYATIYKDTFSANEIDIQ